VLPNDRNCQPAGKKAKRDAKKDRKKIHHARFARFSSGLFRARIPFQVPRIPLFGSMLCVRPLLRRTLRALAV
jgi:hypothetical protein